MQVPALVQCTVQSVRHAARRRSHPCMEGMGRHPSLARLTRARASGLSSGGSSGVPWLAYVSCSPRSGGEIDHPTVAKVSKFLTMHVGLQDAAAAACRRLTSKYMMTARDSLTTTSPSLNVGTWPLWAPGAEQPLVIQTHLHRFRSPASYECAHGQLHDRSAACQCRSRSHLGLRASTSSLLCSSAEHAQHARCRHTPKRYRMCVTVECNTNKHTSSLLENSISRASNSSCFSCRAVHI